MKYSFNFLAHLMFELWLLNSFRSAISSVHEKVDGYKVSQYPLVTRLIKKHGMSADLALV